MTSDEPPAVAPEANEGLVAKLRAAGTPFALGGGRWRCFLVREQGAMRGLSEEPPAVAAREVGRARVAFHDDARADDAGTIRAALVPPQTPLPDAEPYLAFVEDRDLDRAACLGLMSSLVFDWQARRSVEASTLSVLDRLHVPALDDEAYEAVARTAARFSCVDERFTDFARACDVEVGLLTEDERDELRAEIDARVARACRLDERDLETIFADFTLDAVPEPYRERVRARFRELAPRMGQPGWLPDEDAIRRAEFLATTPGERVAEAIAISRTATKIAAAGQRRRER